MARRSAKAVNDRVGAFLAEHLAPAPEEEEREPTSQAITIRVPVELVGDLEDLAGRLDLTRSALAARLLEAAVEEAEEWMQLHSG